MFARWQILAMLLLAAATAGCSMGDIGSPQSPLSPNPPDLAAMTKAAMGIFVNLKLPGSPEISALRPAHPSSLADWMFCMRSDADDIPRDYALFVRNAQIVIYRLAVQIDACALETYAPVGEPR